MPWKENSVLDSRLQFIALHQQHVMSFTDLCRSAGVSRTTGYKLVERYEEYGPSGLHDRPKAPHTHPNATDPETQLRIIQLRTQRPNWGPKKLRTVLIRDFPDGHWPASSTIGELLKGKGLVAARRRRRSATSVAPCDLSNPDSPNSVWTADYKGQFRLQNNQLCYPLTICDAYSRMILKCQALPNTATDHAKAVWVAAFREYGLPFVIRTDNGAPFASVSLGGLSRLSAWWIRLGILPERIQPGKPQQNGSHERMHKTLKQEETSHPQIDLKLQQQAFDSFVYEYDYVRPHESLGQKAPASLYSPSPREYPLALPELEYPSGMIVRHVRTNGEIRWDGGLIFATEVLAGEYVGLDRLDERHYALYYGPVPLAVFDGYKKNWVPAKHAEPQLRKLRQEVRPDPQNC